jgi:hypothetical protein
MIKISEKAKRCCSREHIRLVAQLDACDTNPRSAEDRRRCYRAAAKSTGRRSRKCIVGG